MTPDDFRRMALSLPEAVEGAHMGHPDFRVCGKIFATLAYPGEGLGMVKLTPDQQAAFVKAEPDAFMPVKGGWGLRGSTHVRLEKVQKPALQRALVTAWRNAAPKRLAGPYEPESR
jgi:hypothetical protein